MDAALKLRELLVPNKLNIVPELYDCMSTKAAEMNGFEIVMISSSDLACSLTGIPDLQLLTVDEVVGATDRISNMTNMPILIDADDGYGRPLNAYHACKRLRKAGAAGVLITEGAELGRKGVLPIDEAVLRFKAARDGLGPDGYLIARVDTNPETDFEETIARCRAYREAGADMICVLWLHKIKGNILEMCKKINAYDPGPKWYPDLSSSNGVEEVSLEELAKLNYQMVGVHYSAHAAMIAMLDTGRHVFEEKNNCYVSEHYKDTGYNFFTSMVLFGIADGYWSNIEKQYVKDPQDAMAVRHEYFRRPDDKF